MNFYWGNFQISSFENTYIFLIPQFHIFLVLKGLCSQGGGWGHTQFLSPETGGGSEKTQENWDLKHTIRFDFPRSEQMYCDDALPREAKVTSCEVGDVQSRHHKPTTPPPAPAGLGRRNPHLSRPSPASPELGAPGTASPVPAASPTLLR